MDYPKAMTIREYFAVTGACFAVPKVLWDEIGGLDEGYWAGWEDIDFCNQVREKGYRIVYTPKALVYHYESRTDGRYVAESHNFQKYMMRWVHSGKLVSLNKEEYV
jgi:GT2 family glycosyltransferase